MSFYEKTPHAGPSLRKSWLQSPTTAYVATLPQPSPAIRIGSSSSSSSSRWLAEPHAQQTTGVGRQLREERAALAAAERDVRRRRSAVNQLRQQEQQHLQQGQSPPPTPPPRPFSVGVGGAVPLSPAERDAMAAAEEAHAAHWTSPSLAATARHAPLASADLCSLGSGGEEEGIRGGDSGRLDGLEEERAAVAAARRWGGDFAAQRAGVEALSRLARCPDAARRLVAAGARDLVQCSSSLRPGSSENRRAGAAGAQAALHRDQFLYLTAPHRLAFADVALLAVGMAAVGGSAGGGGDGGGGGGGGSDGEALGLLRLLGNERALHDLEVTRRALLVLAAVLRAAGERGNAAALLRALGGGDGGDGGDGCGSGRVQEAGCERVRDAVARAAHLWAHTCPDVGRAAAEATDALGAATRHARSPTIRWQAFGSPSPSRRRRPVAGRRRDW